MEKNYKKESNNESQFCRTELLIGTDSVNKLKNANVAIFGLGGVGSFTLEGLARAGVGHFILVDHDVISVSNINRQLLATHKTIGQPKVFVAKDRILEINPNAIVEIHKEFFLPDTTAEDNILDESISYIVDAIDTVTAKVELAIRAKKLNIPIISCMGTGNKLNPFLFEITTIEKTSVCPLAKVMRKELKAQGISKLKVLYSKEEPIKLNKNQENVLNIKRPIPASISYVPSVAGLMISGEVIKDLIKK